MEREVRVKLTLDTASYEGGLQRIAQLSDSGVQRISQQAGQAAQAVTKLGQSYSTNLQAWTQQQQAQEKLTQTYGAAGKTYAAGMVEYQKSQGVLGMLRGAWGSFTDTISSGWTSLTSGFGAAEKVFVAAASRVSSFGAAIERNLPGLQGMDLALRRIGLSVGGLSTALTGAAIFGSMALGIKAAADFEDAFANVRRQVEFVGVGTGEAAGKFDELSASLRRISSQTGIAAEGLADIAAEAGHVGLRSVEDISRFAETIGRMAVVTGVSGRTLVSAFAQLSLQLGTSLQDAERMASALIDLGNHARASELEILGFATQIGGIGRLAGLTADQVLGLSAAFASFGAQPMAVNRILLQMQQAVQYSTGSLDLMAKVAGLASDQIKSAGDFQALFRRDAAEAVVLFFEGLGRAGEKGSIVLDQLGLDGARMAKTFIQAGQAVGVFDTSTSLLRENLTRSRQGWQDATKAADEFQVKMDTVWRQLGKLRNAIEQSLIAGFGTTLPVIKAVTTALTDFVELINRETPLLARLAAGAVLTGASFVGMGLAVSVLSRVVGGALAGLGTMVGLLSRLAGLDLAAGLARGLAPLGTLFATLLGGGAAGVIARIGASLSGLLGLLGGEGGFVLLVARLGALLTPQGWIITGLSIVGTLFVGWAVASGRASAALAALTGGLGRLAETVGEVVGNATAALAEFGAGILALAGDAWRPIQDALGTTWRAIEGALGELAAGVAAIAGAIWTPIVEALAPVVDRIAGLWTGLYETVLLPLMRAIGRAALGMVQPFVDAFEYVRARGRQAMAEAAEPLPFVLNAATRTALEAQRAMERGVRAAGQGIQAVAGEAGKALDVLGKPQIERLLLTAERFAARVEVGAAIGKAAMELMVESGARSEREGLQQELETLRQREVAIIKTRDVGILAANQETEGKEKALAAAQMKFDASMAEIVTGRLGVSAKLIKIGQDEAKWLADTAAGIAETQGLEAEAFELKQRQETVAAIREARRRFETEGDLARALTLVDAVEAAKRQKFVEQRGAESQKLAFELMQVGQSEARQLEATLSKETADAIVHAAKLFAVRRDAGLLTAEELRKSEQELADQILLIRQLGEAKWLEFLTKGEAEARAKTRGLMEAGAVDALSETYQRAVAAQVLFRKGYAELSDEDRRAADTRVRSAVAIEGETRAYQALDAAGKERVELVKTIVGLHEAAGLDTLSEAYQRVTQALVIEGRRYADLTDVQRERIDRIAAEKAGILALKGAEDALRGAQKDRSDLVAKLMGLGEARGLDETTAAYHRTMEAQRIFHQTYETLSEDRRRTIDQIAQEKAQIESLTRALQAQEVANKAALAGYAKEVDLRTALAAQDIKRQEDYRETVLTTLTTINEREQKAAIQHAAIEEQKAIASEDFYNVGLATLRRFAAEHDRTWKAMGRLITDTMGNVERALSDTFFDVLTGKVKSLKDVWTGFLNSVLRSLSDFLASQAVTGFLNVLGFSGTPTPGVAAVGGGGAGGTLASGLATGLGGFLGGSAPAAPAPTPVPSEGGGGFFSDLLSGIGSLFGGGSSGSSSASGFDWFARGGRVLGTERGDRVPALLEPGEFVVRRIVAERALPALERLNAAPLGALAFAPFHAGGPVERLVGARTSVAGITHAIPLPASFSSVLAPFAPRRQPTGTDPIWDGPVPSSTWKTGGRVSGVGRGDVVPALLEPGEFVVRREVVEHLLPVLERLNAPTAAVIPLAASAPLPLRFQFGGVAPALFEATGRPVAPQEGPGPILPTIERSIASVGASIAPYSIVAAVPWVPSASASLPLRLQTGGEVGMSPRPEAFIGRQANTPAPGGGAAPPFTVVGAPAPFVSSLIATPSTPAPPPFRFLSGGFVSAHFEPWQFTRHQSLGERAWAMPVSSAPEPLQRLQLGGIALALLPVPTLPALPASVAPRLPLHFQIGGSVPIIEHNRLAPAMPRAPTFEQFEAPTERATLPYGTPPPSVWSTGGPVIGSGRGDVVPALLEPGEFVIRREVVERTLPALERLNTSSGSFGRSDAGPVRYLAGGVVLSPVVPSAVATFAAGGRVERSGDGAAGASRNESSDSTISREVFERLSSRVDRMAGSVQLVVTGLLPRLQSGGLVATSPLFLTPMSMDTSVAGAPVTATFLSERLLWSEEGFGRGGRVPGVGRGDIVPALLEPGEFVVRREIVERALPLFERLNGPTPAQLPRSAAAPPDAEPLHFQTGGVVPSAFGLSPLEQRAAAGLPFDRAWLAALTSPAFAQPVGARTGGGPALTPQEAKRTLSGVVNVLGGGVNVLGGIGRREPLSITGGALQVIGGITGLAGLPEISGLAGGIGGAVSLASGIAGGNPFQAVSGGFQLLQNAGALTGAIDRVLSVVGLGQLSGMVASGGRSVSAAIDTVKGTVDRGIRATVGGLLDVAGLGAATPAVVTIIEKSIWPTVFNALGAAASGGLLPLVGAVYGGYKMFSEYRSGTLTPESGAGHGAGIGASLGTMIAPGPGTAIGALTGAAVGYFLGWLGERPAFSPETRAALGLQRAEEQGGMPAFMAEAGAALPGPLAGMFGGTPIVRTGLGEATGFLGGMSPYGVPATAFPAPWEARQPTVPVPAAMPDILSRYLAYLERTTPTEWAGVPYAYPTSGVGAVAGLGGEFESATPPMFAAPPFTSTFAPAAPGTAVPTFAPGAFQSVSFAFPTPVTATAPYWALPAAIAPPRVNWAQLTQPGPSAPSFWSSPSWGVAPAPERVVSTPLPEAYGTGGLSAATYAYATERGWLRDTTAGPIQPATYTAPSYGAPNYAAPSYGAPTYGAVSYGAPSYTAPSYAAPSFGASYSAPTYGGDFFSAGGRVPGTDRGDIVPALLEPGEFVVRREISERHREVLTRLNATAPIASAGAPLRLQLGGLVERASHDATVRLHRDDVVIRGEAAQSLPRDLLGSLEQWGRGLLTLAPTAEAPTFSGLPTVAARMDRFVQPFEPRTEGLEATPSGRFVASASMLALTGGMPYAPQFRAPATGTRDVRFGPLGPAAPPTPPRAEQARMIPTLDYERLLRGAPPPVWSMGVPPTSYWAAQPAPVAMGTFWASPAWGGPAGAPAPASPAASEPYWASPAWGGPTSTAPTYATEYGENWGGGYFARGGPVPGTGRGDIIPALLEPGEFVVRREVVERHATLLERLNRTTDGVPGLAGMRGRDGTDGILRLQWGGPVRRLDAPQRAAALPTSPTRAGREALPAGPTGLGPVTIGITVNGNVDDPQALAHTLAPMLRDELRRIEDRYSRAGAKGQR